MPTAPEDLEGHFARLGRLLKLSALLNTPLVLACAALVAAFASDAPGTPTSLILGWGLGFLLLGLLEAVALPLLALRRLRRPPHPTGWVVAYVLFSFFLGPWGPVLGFLVLREAATVRRLRPTPASCG